MHAMQHTAVTSIITVVALLVCLSCAHEKRSETLFNRTPAATVPITVGAVGRPTGWAIQADNGDMILNLLTVDSASILPLTLSSRPPVNGALRCDSGDVILNTLEGSTTIGTSK